MKLLDGAVDVDSTGAREDPVRYATGLLHPDHPTSDGSRRCRYSHPYVDREREMTDTLRERLLRDFGHDLPISGGSGSSREDPIRILSAEPGTIALTEWRTLDNLSQVFGTYWRSLGRTLLGPEWPGIEQHKYATVSLTDTEVIKERKNHYFDVSALPPTEWRSIMAAAPVSGGRLPFELGWLHARVYDTDRLPSAAMVPYRAPGIEAMLHVYRPDEGDAAVDLQDALVRRHFGDAVEMVFRTTKGAEPFAEPFVHPRMLVKNFMIGPRAEHATLVGLTTARGHYVKMRITWERDHFIDGAAREWLEAALYCVGRGESPQ